ncbi:hypothetical protein G6045_08745 [Streptomyces sp. YC504]|uniref:Uncharacterized protein n=1 Tax=Streptomyces mesophilus TaxID=1775132 RepID=A0A6G4XFY6_9ACTN|nr:hypothetical protein [Streptomyces mesophilus]NGO75760.1 hypothetical protein [Streptomyces mesophilus]
MALISLVSAASDGVTTSAAGLALGSERPVLLAECDMSGGTLRGRLLREIRRPFGPLDAKGRVQQWEPLGPHIGLHKVAESFFASGGQDETNFIRQVEPHFWPLDDSDERFALPGLIDPRQAASLREVWPSLVHVLQLVDHELKVDVVVDGGRMVLEGGHPHPVLSPAPLLHQSDIVLLVIRLADPASVMLAAPMVEALQDELSRHGTGARALGLLTLGNNTRREFHPGQVERELEAPVVGSLAWDETAAAYLHQGGKPPRNLSRSALLRGARDVMQPLRAYANQRRLQLQLRQVQPGSPQAMAQIRQLVLAQRQGALRG